MKVTFDTKSIQSISLFQNITGAAVIDYLEENDTLFFVVSQGQYGLAVGKNGTKIKTAERTFKKMIKVFEYSPELKRFVQNMVPEAQEIDVNEKDVILKLKPIDRAKIIGRQGKNIKILTKFLQRLFEINELKVK